MSDIKESTTLLPSLGVIRISGQDSIKFLQGQLTINPEKVEQGSSSLAAVCNPQGRVISLFWIAKSGDEFLLVLPKDNIDNTLNHLKKYAVFFKTTIKDCANSHFVAAINSSPSDGLLDVAIQFPAKLDSSLDIAILRNDNQNSQELNSKPGNGEPDWFYQLAKQGIPWISSEASGLFLPHYLNLPALGAVDFSKGCFTGQEVIARMHYKGKLKTHLQILESDQEIHVTPGTKITTEEKSVGEVVCSASNTGKIGVLLCVLKDSSLDREKFHLNQKNEPILKLTKN
ncbi:MAG: hypothetical protein OQJ89_13500 [Kangiellaceae bacterium]|nr:hypothetical protein [Kangiellaceae bacterium]MCW8997731.1 hypothetical protein [Kangiellaceae bacterium]MCW9017980.1 hypothetical protein [Kangiellaceae bacterium]